MDKKRVRVLASFNSNMFVRSSCQFGPNQNKQMFLEPALIFRALYFFKFILLTLFTDFLSSNKGTSRVQSQWTAVC